MMTDYVRNDLREAIEGWADRHRPSVHLIDYRARFMGGKTFLGIETADSARTLHSIASYMEGKAYPPDPRRALFDERSEDVLYNGCRVIYWQELPAKHENNSECEDKRKRLNKLKQQAKDALQQADHAAKMTSAAQAEVEDALATLKDALFKCARATGGTKVAYKLTETLNDALSELGSEDTK